MADNTEKLLKDIIGSLQSVEMAAGSPDIDLSGIHERLERIADRIADLMDVVQSQTEELVEALHALAPEKDQSPLDDDDSDPTIF